MERLPIAHSITYTFGLISSLLNGFIVIFNFTKSLTLFFLGWVPFETSHTVREIESQSHLYSREISSLCFAFWNITHQIEISLWISIVIEEKVVWHKMEREKSMWSNPLSKNKSWEKFSITTNKIREKKPNWFSEIEQERVRKNDEDDDQLGRKHKKTGIKENEKKLKYETSEEVTRKHTERTWNSMATQKILTRYIYKSRNGSIYIFSVHI